MIVLSVIVGVVGCVLYMINAGLLPVRLPYPYSSVPLQIIDPEYLSIIDAVADATPTAVHKYALRHGISVTLLDSQIHTLFKGRVFGSESVSVTSMGDLIVIDKYGHLRIANPTSTSFTLSNSSIYIGPGRPLGFHVYDDDTLLVCDSIKGLLQVDISLADNATGDRVRTLTNAVSSEDIFHYANDLDISTDKRKIYFTSSTSEGTVAYDDTEHYYDTMRSYILTWLAGDVSGRVLAYDIESRRTEVVSSHLYYANGVLVSRDGTYLLVVETVALRVMKIFLTGEKKGQQEVFIDALPGFPDGLSLSSDGHSILISVVAPLTPFYKLAKGRLVRFLLSWALAGPAKSLFSGLIKHIGCVMRVSLATGAVQEILLDPAGRTVATISATTEVSTEQGRRLYFGNLGGDSVAYYEY